MLILSRKQYYKKLVHYVLNVLYGYILSPEDIKYEIKGERIDVYRFYLDLEKWVFILSIDL